MAERAPQSLTCSTRDAAHLLGISIRTAQLWVEDGRLRAWKTPGGHRRILMESVNALLTEQRAAGLDLRPRPAGIMLLRERTRERMTLRNTLAAALPQCTLHTVSSGYEALIRIGELKPEVLITDLGLSGVDFFQMIHALIGCTAERRMRIIVLLASNVDRATVGARLPEDVTLVDPPVDGTELAALVWGLLRETPQPPPRRRHAPLAPRLG